MTAKERAADIESSITNDLGLQQGMAHAPLIGEVPLDASQTRFGLILNWYIQPSTVSLTSLWSYTIPLMRALLSSGKLSEFNVIESRIHSFDGAFPERVLSVQSLVEEINRLPLHTAADLLREDWTNDRFACHWYRDKKMIAA